MKQKNSEECISVNVLCKSLESLTQNCRGEIEIVLMRSKINFLVCRYLV